MMTKMIAIAGIGMIEGNEIGTETIEVDIVIAIEVTVEIETGVHIDLNPNAV